MVNGRKIEALRKDAGLLQAELGRKVFVSQSMIDYIEKGVKKPGIELLKRIADLFGVTVDELLEEKEVS